MKYLLDTDHISVLQRPGGALHSRLSRRVRAIELDELAFSIVSFHEQYQGAQALANKARTTDEVIRAYGLLGQILESYATAVVLPFDRQAATAFEMLKADGVRCSTMDLRIAAIALAFQLILVTRNTRDFASIENLETENWID